MSKQIEPFFYWSWKIREESLPPYHLFPLIEFIFKIVTWGLLISVIQFGAARVDNDEILFMTTVLKNLLALAVSERVSRSVSGRIQPNGKLGLALVVGVIVILFAISVVIAGYTTYKLQFFINDLVLISDKTR